MGMLVNSFRFATTEGGVGTIYYDSGLDEPIDPDKSVYPLVFKTIDGDYEFDSGLEGAT